MGFGERKWIEPVQNRDRSDAMSGGSFLKLTETRAVEGASPIDRGECLGADVAGDGRFPPDAG